MSLNQLYDAAYRGNFDLIKVKVDEDASIINKPDNNSRLLLHWSCVGGHAELVSYFLEAGCPLEAAEDSGATPLVLASVSGHYDVVRILVSRGAAVNHKNNQGHSALQYACSKGFKEIAELLLNNGANINITDNLGATPLHRAATQGRMAILEVLFKYSDILKINTQDNYGNTPLHLACEEGRDDVASKLVIAGADLTLQNKDKQTPLDLASNSLASALKALKEREMS